MKWIKKEKKNQIKTINNGPLKAQKIKKSARENHSNFSGFQDSTIRLLQQFSSSLFLPSTNGRNRFGLIPPSWISLIAAGKIQFPGSSSKTRRRFIFCPFSPVKSFRRWCHPKTLIGFATWLMLTMEVSQSKVLVSLGLFSNLLVFLQTPGFFFTSLLSSIRVPICLFSETQIDLVWN